MKIECTYKKMKPQPDIFHYCQQRLNRIEELYNYPLHCRLNLVAERYDVAVELRVDGNRAHFKSSGRHESVYTAIDQAVEKMQKQLTKKKAKMKNHRVSGDENVVYLDQLRVSTTIKKAN